MEKIRLVPTDSAEPEEFYVLEQVKLGGKMYLLVTDEEEGDGMALILRDDAEEGSDESLYAVAFTPSWKTTTNSRQRFFSLATSWKRWGF